MKSMYIPNQKLFIDYSRDLQAIEYFFNKKGYVVTINPGIYDNDSLFIDLDSRTPEQILSDVDEFIQQNPEQQFEFTTPLRVVRLDIDSYREQKSALAKQIRNVDAIVYNIRALIGEYKSSVKNPPRDTIINQLINELQELSKSDANIYYNIALTLNRARISSIEESKKENKHHSSILRWWKTHHSCHLACMLDDFMKKLIQERYLSDGELKSVKHPLSLPFIQLKV